jgi:2-ketoarginine methyltransferase
MSRPAADYEHRLIENLQPIRQFFLAATLHHTLQAGVLDALADEPGADADGLADGLALDVRRLHAVLIYLQNEGYVVDDEGWRLTGRGAAVREFAPWYQMLVGGYGGTFGQLGQVLRDGAVYASRDTSQVGAGSTGIGVTDTLPLALDLMDRASTAATTLIDLGCGDAAFLMEILARRPGLLGIGLDPHPGNIERAQRLCAERGLERRLRLVQGTADVVADLDLLDQGRGVAFLTAFVLQEMLEQQDEQAVLRLLSHAFDAAPAASWVVVEMDHQPTAPLLGAHGLARAFYNPYFLIHSITEQRLETRAWWAALFEKAGLDIAEATTDPRVDSTGLEIGFLLSRP